MKLLLLSLALIPLMACGAEWDVTARISRYEALPNCGVAETWPHSDSTRVETDIDSLIVRGWRFTVPGDTITLGVIPIRGMEGDSVNFTLDIEPGTMGELLLWTKDKLGRVSCRALHYVFAMPAIDSSSVASLSPWYRVVREK